MRTLLVLAVIPFLVVPATAGVACTGTDCTCAGRSCCTEVSGCCHELLEAIDGCGCEAGGCSECASCEAPEPIVYVDTAADVTVPPVGALLVAEAAMEPPRIAGTSCVSLGEPLPPPGRRLHLRNCVWLT